MGDSLKCPGSSSGLEWCCLYRTILCGERLKGQCGVEIAHVDWTELQMGNRKVSWNGSKCSQSEHKWCYYFPFPASQFTALPACLPLDTKQQPEESLKQSLDPKIAFNSDTSGIEKCVVSRESMCKHQTSPNCRDVCLLKPTPLCFRGNNLLLK